MYLAIGFGNYINADEIVAVRPYDTKKLIGEVRARINAEPTQKALVQDCTKGKKKASVVICKDGVYYVTAKTTKTLVAQLNRLENEEE